MCNQQPVPKITDAALSTKLEIVHHFRSFILSIQTLSDITIDYSNTTNPSLHYLYHSPAIHTMHGPKLQTNYLKPDWIAHQLKFMSVYDTEYNDKTLGTQVRNVHAFFYQIRDQLTTFTITNYFDSTIVTAEGEVKETFRITRLWKRLEEDLEEAKDFVTRNMLPYAKGPDGAGGENMRPKTGFLKRLELGLCRELQLKLMGIALEMIRAETVRRVVEVVDKVERILNGESVPIVDGEEEPRGRVFKYFNGKRAESGELPWECVGLLLFFRNLRAESVESRVWRYLQDGEKGQQLTLNST